MLPTSDPPRGPLHGVQVLDLSRVLAGPFCTLLLWELGAEVLKIELPGHGDDTRAFPPFQNGESVYFASVNRGKRSLALDLKSSTDREVFNGLLAQSDVLVENFRPGAMERLGYDWPTIQKHAPSIVYARVSGFGQTGPYRDRPAYDLIVQAIGGMMSINGPEGGEGHRLGVSLGDTGAGLFAALAVASALYERRESGAGRLVDIAMLDCQTMLLEAALVRYFATGVSEKPSGSRHQVIAPFDVFRTADQPIAIGCANDHLFAKLASALDRPDWAKSERYATLPARHLNQPDLKADIEAALASDSAAEWLEKLGSAGIPCAPLHDMAQVASDPQLAARGAFVTVDDPEMGRLTMTGSPFHISGFERPATRPPAPNLDEAREAVLDELRRQRIRRPAMPPVW
ncbi:CoA transferase [bacterium]|nr:CoA transferase [bacterium]